MKNLLTEEIKKALDALEVTDVEIEVTKPALAENGDFSTNIAMKLARTLKKNPMLIAEEIVSKIDNSSIKNIEIKAPAIDLNKDEIVKLGDEIKAPMELSYSCYSGHEKHCGVCESCMRRKRAFKLADVKDPSEYNE